MECANEGSSSHNHSHGHSHGHGDGDHGHDGHDHDVPLESVPADSLYSQIDLEHVEALNAQGGAESGRKVIKCVLFLNLLILTLLSTSQAPTDRRTWERREDESIVRVHAPPVLRQVVLRV